MPTIEARIPTDRPGRYRHQFTSHASAMSSPRASRMRGHAGGVRAEVQLHVESTDTQTTVTFSPWGRCVLSDDTDTLIAHIEATDDQALQRIQEIVTHDLNRFGLTAPWQSIDDGTGSAR
ncbi:DUF2218 domain-containing protein [Nocardia sp. NPDC052112]|uniref:DUF2218 domain-containing protein n=1 Tax=Nocardia sp. NPDC052112 TaxID=3155646 RepID=UPI00341883D1